MIAGPRWATAGVLWLAVGTWPLSGQEVPARLSITDAVRRGLDHDPGLGAAAARSDAAGAAVGEATAFWFPRVLVTASATQFEQPMVVSPIHGFLPGQTPPFDETLIQAGASLSYTLLDGGARPARVGGARALAAAAEAAHDASRQDFIAQVVTAYLTVLSTRTILDAHDLRMAALESELGRVRQRREVGTAAHVDVLRVEAARASATAQRVGFAASLDVAERDLARLIGVDVERARADLLAEVGWVDTTLPDRDELSRLALVTNPAVAQARREVSANEANQRVARSARWPTLDLFGAWIDRGSGAGNFTAEWNVGVQFSYPIFTGGAVSRGIARADATRRESDARLRMIENQVASNVDRARAAVEEAQARITSLQIAVTRFAEVARIERLRLDTGAGTETDFLTAHAELLSARADLAEAVHREIAARVGLARTIGQLDLGWLEQQLESVP